MRPLSVPPFCAGHPSPLRNPCSPLLIGASPVVVSALHYSPACRRGHSAGASLLMRISIDQQSAEKTVFLADFSNHRVKVAVILLYISVKPFTILIEMTGIL